MGVYGSNFDYGESPFYKDDGEETFYVDFTSNKTSGFAPLAVLFTTVLSPEQSGETYLWDFGNYRTSTKRNPIIVFNKSGIYTVSLTVIGSSGFTAIKTKVRYIMIHELEKGDLWFSFVDNNTADLQMVNNDIKMDASLETSAFISLFSDKRSDDNTILSTNNKDKRGWWADNNFGSLLWTLQRETISNELQRKAEQFAAEALQWMIDYKLVESINVTVIVQRVAPQLLINIALIQNKNNQLLLNYMYDINSQIAGRL